MKPKPTPRIIGRYWAARYTDCGSIHKVYYTGAPTLYKKRGPKHPNIEWVRVMLVEEPKRKRKEKKKAREK